MEPMERTLPVKAGGMSDVSPGRLEASALRKRSVHLSGGSRAGGSVAVVPRPPATFSRQTAFLKSPPEPEVEKSYGECIFEFNGLSVRILPTMLSVLPVLSMLSARVGRAARAACSARPRSRQGLSAPRLQSPMLSRPTFPTPPSQRIQCMLEDNEDELFLSKLPLSSL